MESSCANQFEVIMRYERWLNSVFRQMNSLFGRKQIPVPVAREFLCKAMELLKKLNVGIAKMAANLLIPCYFPCCQGIRGIDASRSVGWITYPCHCPA